MLYKSVPTWSAIFEHNSLNSVFIKIFEEGLLHSMGTTLFSQIFLKQSRYLDISVCVM